MAASDPRKPEPVDESLFEPPRPSPELAARAKDAGWPEGMVERAVALRLPAGMVDSWITSGFPPAMLDRYLADRERLAAGTLRVRSATWEDDDVLADLYANAPEEVGDWEVTVERSPNPFARHRLQEHPYVQVLEDRGVLLGTYSGSCANPLIEGREVSAGILSSWRIRKGFRGRGYSNLVRNHPGPSTAWFPMVSVWYVRLENAAALGWMRDLTDEWEDRPDEWALDVKGLSATVFHLRGEGRRDARVRATTRDDLARCVALVNRTHAGLDLFRPYTEERLRGRLDDPFWGPKPPFWADVYGWGDHAVLVDGGEIVACAGLWDQGRNQRERWRDPKGGEERVVDHTALLDFGCAEGREDALAALIGHLAVRSKELGRATLVAPLEFLPAVREALAWAKPEPETRGLHVMPFAAPGLKLDVAIERPYTDLAYW